MLTSEEALGINKVMKVDPTSKTPYSDATQVGLTFFLSFVAWCFTFQFGKGSVALESCYHIQSHFGGEIAR